jgi:hypothetical protein
MLYDCFTSTSQHTQPSILHGANTELHHQRRTMATKQAAAATAAAAAGAAVQNIRNGISAASKCATVLECASSNASTFDVHQSVPDSAKQACTLSDPAQPKQCHTVLLN